MTPERLRAFEGTARLIGDNIDTDGIIPARYCTSTDEQVLARHCLEDAAPALAATLRPGDILVAGHNFGCGSSREAAVMALRGAGIVCVVARSFAGIFYRNAVNCALPALECPDASERAAEGDRLHVDLGAGLIRNLTKGESYAFRQPGAVVSAIWRAGGLLAHVAARAAHVAGDTAK